MGVLLLGLRAVLLGFVITTVANAATTIYLHRGLSHRALRLRGPAPFVFRTVVWLSTGIRPREWVAVHRKHHAYTDEVDDPHSPVVLGWRTVQMKNVALYRAALRDPHLVEKYARDLPRDRWDVALFDRSALGLTLGTVILVLVFGGLTEMGAAVNALGHHFGRRPYANLATNLQWLAFYTMGEGLHNNHHAAPSSPRLSHRRSEIDPGWWVIRALSLLGLAQLRFADIRLTASSKVPTV